MAPQTRRQYRMTESRHFSTFQINKPITGSRQMSQARKITIREIRRILEDIPNLTKLLQSVKLLETAVRSDNVLKSAQLTCLGNTSNVVEVMTTQFFQRLIDQKKIGQSLAPVRRASFEQYPNSSGLKWSIPNHPISNSETRFREAC